MKYIIVIICLIAFTSCENTSGNKKSNDSANYADIIPAPKSEKEKIVFIRKTEPKENAFSLLVPQSWQSEGGIFRVDPLGQGGPSQSIAAKLDFSVKKDNIGSVMIRWLPDVLFFDARYSPAGQMGLFPEGSNYQGMTVYNLMSPETFISNIAFPYAHKNVQNFKVIESKKLNNVANNYHNRVKQAMPYSTMTYDAAYLKYSYMENGEEFEEIMFTLIENWGQLGAGMWGNKETFLVRAPLNELSKWEGVFSVIQNSVKLNLKWLIGELRGQATRGEIALNTQKEIERIGREITQHKQKTNAEINNDMYLTLTDQEEYVNPYTNEIEIGTNQWQYRWVSESGDVIYTDSEEYNPNIDINLNRSDFKRSRIRERFPQ